MLFAVVVLGAWLFGADEPQNGSGGVGSTEQSHSQQLGQALLAMVATAGMPTETAFVREKAQQQLGVAIRWQTGLQTSFIAVRGPAQLTCAEAGELYAYRLLMSGRPAYAVANAEQVAALQQIDGEKVYYLADCNEVGVPGFLEQQPSEQAVELLFPDLASEEAVRAPVRDAFRLMHRRYETDKGRFKRAQIERALKAAAQEDEQLADMQIMGGSSPQIVLACERDGLQVWISPQGHSAAVSYNDGEQIAFMARVRAQILELTVMSCAELAERRRA